MVKLSVVRTELSVGKSNGQRTNGRQTTDNGQF